MLQELMDEMEELLTYKKKYEYAEADKKVMSNLIYEFMQKEYDATTYEERCLQYRSSYCRMCRLNDDCEKILSEDIFKPIPSDTNYIPGKKSCGRFRYS